MAHNTEGIYKKKKKQINEILYFGGALTSTAYF